MRKATPEAIFIAAMALICLSISTYQTALGYSDAAGGLLISVPLSILISGAMGLISLHLWNSSTGSPERLNLLSIYIFVSFFSVAANFNVFFSSEVAGEVAKEEIALARDLLNELESDINISISVANSESTELISELEREKTILVHQILDVNRPGVGTRAKEVINRINRLLNTELSLPNEGDAKMQAEMLEKQVDAIIAQERAETSGNYASLLETTDRKFGEIRKILDRAEASGDPIGTIDTVALAHQMHNEIGTSAEDLLLYAGRPFETSQPTHENDFGSIPFAIDYALSGEKSTAATISMLLAILIDYTIPFLILLIHRKDESSAPDFPGPRRYNQEPFV